jgi:hypothetical protein
MAPTTGRCTVTCGRITQGHKQRRNHFHNLQGGQVSRCLSLQFVREGVGRGRCGISSYTGICVLDYAEVNMANDSL